MSLVNRPLVISMAFNGYQVKWRRAITSHSAYCQRKGYDYVFVHKPALTRLLMECPWLKISLILAGLQSGWEWVLFVDSDAVITDICPPVESVAEEGKSIFMVNGNSGRANSGMILVHNDPAVRSLLKTILSNAFKPLPPEDVVWAENGHVIHYCKTFPGLKLLGTEWNNTFDVGLKDYIRHYCAGPMRQLYMLTPTELLVGKMGSLYTKLWRKLLGESPRHEFFNRINDLMRIALANYPALGGVFESVSAAPGATP